MKKFPPQTLTSLNSFSVLNELDSILWLLGLKVGGSVRVKGSCTLHEVNSSSRNFELTVPNRSHNGIVNFGINAKKTPI